MRDRTVNAHAQAMAKSLRRVFNEERDAVVSTVRFRAAGGFTLAPLQVGQIIANIRAFDPKVANALEARMRMAAQDAWENARQLIQSEQDAITHNVLDAIRVRAQTVAQSLGDQRVFAVQRLIDEGQFQTNNEMAAAIKERYANLSAGRLDGISRTETAFVHERAAYTQWQEAGVRQLEFIEQGGPCATGVCPDAAAGSPYDIGHAFESVWDTFPQAPPLHPFCICLMVPLVGPVSQVLDEPEPEPEPPTEQAPDAGFTQSPLFADDGQPNKDTAKAFADMAWGGTQGQFDTLIKRIYFAGDAFSVQGDISFGELLVGKFERMVSSGRLAGTNETTVYHTLLKLEPAYQGQGFAELFNAQAEAAYRAAGVQSIQLHANITVGGYAWARQGYDWAPGTEPDDLGYRQFKTVIDEIGMFPRTALDIASEIDFTKPRGAYQDLQAALTAADLGDFTKAIWNRQRYIPYLTEQVMSDIIELSVRMQSGYVPKPIELAVLGEAGAFEADGRLTWFGKRLLLGSGWQAQKRL